MKEKIATEKDQYTFLIEIKDPKKHWQTRQLTKNISTRQVLETYVSNMRQIGCQ